jgi:SAM-dependent methyltransferase
MDDKKVAGLADRVLADVTAAMGVLNVYVGHRLGLFTALAESGPVSPAQLAAHTRCAERYVREWLECMTVMDYVDHDAATGRFSLSPEQAEVLARRDSASYMAPFACFVPSLVRPLEQLLEAFRSGGGVPYEAYGQDAIDAIGLGNRPMFLHEYTTKWIPTMPDVEARLRAGARVADLGCGVGWSAVALARAFPRVRVDAVDIDAASIERARHNAAEHGVADRIAFHVAPAETAPLTPPYDLVTAFECVHDMAYPVPALRRMRELAGPRGAVVVADEAVGETVDDNRNAIGRLNYNFSVLHCLPQALVFPGAAGTGTVLRPSTLAAYAREAGFGGMQVLPIDNPLWRFYRLTP